MPRFSQVIMKGKQIEVIRTKTGIKGLDKLLYGGIPKGNLVVVSGGPGAGKTTMCLQYLYEGAKAGEPGIYISLEPTKEELVETGLEYGWDIQSLIDKKLLEIVKVPLYDFEKLKTLIEDLVDKHKAQRLVIDPAGLFKLFFDKELEVRKAILELGELLKKVGCTTFLTIEMEGTSKSAFYGLEEYIADGVILLYHTQVATMFVRTIAILKMRGTKISEKLSPLNITEQGVEVLTEEEVFSEGF